MLIRALCRRRREPASIRTRSQPGGAERPDFWIHCLKPSHEKEKKKMAMYSSHPAAKARLATHRSDRGKGTSEKEIPLRSPIRGLGEEPLRRKRKRERGEGGKDLVIEDRVGLRLIDKVREKGTS